MSEMIEKFEDIDNVIVGFDGTGPSAEAVMWAAAEADVRERPLRIVSCYTVPMLAGEAALGWGQGAAVEAMSVAAEAHAAQIAATVSAAHPGLQFTSEVAPGPASTALLVGAGPDDLVVVGGSSHEGAAAFWLGSTPRHLVHHSPCPVAVIRGSASRGAPDRLVVGVDGSPAADAALRWAADEADRHGVELLVVHAWEYPYTPVDIASMQGRDLMQVDAACTLEAAAEIARERCGVTVTTHLVEGGPSSSLLGVVHDGDLLVVGSRGRGALRSRLFGSTANSVLDGSAGPVIVVRAAADSDSGASSSNRSVLTGA